MSNVGAVSFSAVKINGRQIPVSHRLSYEELERKVHELEEEALVRTRAAKALHESEERYRSLVETSSDFLWEVDANGRYTYANSRVREILGYAPEEVVGRTPFDLMPEEEARRVGAIFAEIAAERRPFSLLENVNLHRDGRRVVLETSGVPVFGPNGEFAGYRGVDRDITKRKQAEEAVRQSEAVLRSLLEATPAGVGLLVDRVFLKVNAALCRITGYSELEMVGLSTRILYPDNEEFIRTGREMYEEMRKRDWGYWSLASNERTARS